MMQDKIYVPGYLILEKQGEILCLQRQGTGWMDGHWSLPAGHIEVGESIFQGMIREAHEELGIHLAPQDLELIHVWDHVTNRHNIAFFFRATHWEGEPFNKEPNKCGGIGFYPKDALPQPFIPILANVLQNRIWKGTSYTAEGFPVTKLPF